MRRLALGAGSAGLLLLLLAACREAPRAAPGDADYTLRGEIARLPAAGSPELWLRHEALPEFRDARGEVVGMLPMTMPFQVAPGLALDGFAPGDRVEVRLEMRWGDRPGATVARIAKLPAGTRLSWEADGETSAPAPAQPAETPR